MAAVPPQIPGLVGWRPLARGGFATVWEAKQLSLNRLVAVKVDKRTLTSDNEQRRFLREAGAAGRMSGHPGIVTVHDAGILTDDRPYLVMALCEGGSLTKWVKGAPRPTTEQVREVGTRIADALAATHARGVLHRDVKPANILIDSYGHAGLADFGLAALPDPGMELSETLEAITPAYAPPEVFNRRPPTEAGDVYSLGATLYAVLAGRPPHWPDSGTPNIVDMFERLRDPIDRIPDVDDGLMDALLAALAYEAEDRPSAADFRDRLAGLQLASASDAEVDGAGGAGAAAAGAVNGLSKPGSASVQLKDKLETSPRTKDDEPFVEPHPSIAMPVTVPPDERRPRRRTVLLVAAVAMLLAVSLTVALANLLPRSPVANPTVGGAPGPTGGVSGAPSSGTTPAPSAAPTPAEGSVGSKAAGVPASFVDCSEQLGSERTYCTPEPECWGSVRSYADGPRTSEAAGCAEEHLYQTFAAGELERVPTRLSTLEELPAVAKTCRDAVVNSMLVNPSDQLNWEVYAIGPQNDDEQFFRCLFGRGVRSAPIAIQPPR